MASIAAIAHVELKTKYEEQDIGTRIVIEGSEVTEQEAAVVPTGTTISVKNLFYNIPARRNFLKSNLVETRHIIDEFHRVSLAHPHVNFIMLNNGSDVFNLPVTKLRQRIVNVFGTKMNEKLVPVQEETEVVKVSGFVLKPQFAKKGRGEQFFFVNNRFIKSPYLHHAVHAAFDGLIREGSHPGYFLFLEVDTKSIDINIHPTKTEIKFDDEHTIYAMLRATIKHSLGQFSISPALDFNKDSEFETPYSYSKKAPISPIIEVDSDYNPFKKESSQSKISFPFKREKNSSWESLYIGLNQDSGETDTLLGNIEFESEEVTGSLFESETESVGQITFQMYNKYIVCPIKSGLMIIHQNLAHQRVLYEEILKNITVKEAVSQQLLFPIQLEFSTPDLEIIEKIKEQLENTGFIFSAFRESKVEIEGIPATITEGQVKDVLEQLLNDVKEEVPDAGFSQNDLLAKSLAKSMSIKTGASLNNKEQEHLVNQLFACKEPMVSPSNKPIFVTLNVADFDKKFM